MKNNACTAILFGFMLICLGLFVWASSVIAVFAMLFMQPYDKV